MHPVGSYYMDTVLCFGVTCFLPSSERKSTLKSEGRGYSETSTLIYHTTSNHTSEDSTIHSHQDKNLKFHKSNAIYGTALWNSYSDKLPEMWVSKFPVRSSIKNIWNGPRYLTHPCPVIARNCHILPAELHISERLHLTEASCAAQNQNRTSLTFTCFIC